MYNHRVNDMKITVFGSARPLPGEPDYEQAYRLGQLIAHAHGTTISGGYAGTMAAVSAGAQSSGGHVIGVTCTQIEAWRPTRANEWVKQEIVCQSLNERIQELILLCDAAIALPGGPGTLAEISLFWNMATIQAIPHKPLVLVGQGWKAVFEAMQTHLNGYTTPVNWQTLQFAETVDEAFERVCTDLDGANQASIPM